MNKPTKMGKAWIGAALTAIALVCVRPAVAQIGIVSVTGGRIEGVTADQPEITVRLAGAGVDEAEHEASIESVPAYRLSRRG